MALLRTGLSHDAEPQLRGPRLTLRPPIMADYVAWAELRARSRAHLVPWEPAWSHDELSRGSYRRRLKVHQRDQREDIGYAFFLFARPGNALIGGLTLSNVRRGVTQAGALGYWIGQPHAQQGYMTEAVGVAAHFAFEHLGLHRIEAACLPHNRGSIGVLRNNGFREEGFAKQYLKINGDWQDHVLFALLEDDLE